MVFSDESLFTYADCDSFRANGIFYNGKFKTSGGATVTCNDNWSEHFNEIKQSIFINKCLMRNSRPMRLG